MEVRAWEGGGVEIRQRIQAWAPSRGEAQQVARQVRVHTDGGTIYADARHPGWRAHGGGGRVMRQDGAARSRRSTISSGRLVGFRNG